MRKLFWTIMIVLAVAFSVGVKAEEPKLNIELLKSQLTALQFEWRWRDSEIKRMMAEQAMIPIHRDFIAKIMNETRVLEEKIRGEEARINLEKVKAKKAKLEPGAEKQPEKETSGGKDP